MSLTNILYNADLINQICSEQSAIIGVWRAVSAVITILCIAVVVLLVIAMRYMISSAGDRADIKKHAVAYVIGTFVLFAATQIILALVDIAGQLGGETGASST